MTYRRNYVNNTPVNYNCVSVSRFINRTLSELSPGTPNVISNRKIFSPELTTYIFQEFDPSTLSTVNGNAAFVLVNITNSQGFKQVPLQNGTLINPENYPAIDIVAQLAATEGCIVGSGVNPFYRPRINATASVTIAYQQCIDLSYQQAFNAFKYFFEGFQATRLNSNVDPAQDRQMPQIQNTSINVGLNPSATKAATFVFETAYPFLSTGTVLNTTTVNVNGQLAPTNLNSTLEMITAGGRNYFYSLAQNDTAMISGTIRGVTRLKPYETIVFGSDAPTRYQGITFRPTYLSYNLKTDEVKFKAYSIT
jgi:hypothetical protein